MVFKIISKIEYLNKIILKYFQKMDFKIEFQK